MMTLSEGLLEELFSYRRLCLKVGASVLGILCLFIALAYSLAAVNLLYFLLGSLYGVILAIINIFALGYAVYELVFKKISRLAILWPFFTFTAMCLTALFISVYYPSKALGFAFGLTSPLLLAAAIVFLSTKPG